MPRLSARCHQLAVDAESFGPSVAVASPYADLRDAEPPRFDTGDVPWWDPEADASVQPESTPC